MKSFEIVFYYKRILDLKSAKIEFIWHDAKLKHQSFFEYIHQLSQYSFMTNIHFVDIDDHKPKINLNAYFSVRSAFIFQFNFEKILLDEMLDDILLLDIKFATDFEMSFKWR